MTDVTPEQVGSEPTEPAPKKRLTTKTWVIIAAAAAVVVATVLGIVAATATSHPTNGFYNMNTLEQSVQQQVDQNNNYGYGATVESCSMTGSTTANCIVDDNGQTSGVTVSISTDGNTWAQTNP